jgi:phosphoribosylformylglycinamidine synthase
MGFYFHKPAEKLFEQATADVLVMASDIKVFAGLGVEYVGEVQTGVSFEFGTKVLNTFGVSQNFTSHFERKFPTVATNMRGMVENHRYRSTKEMKCINPIRPRVFIPVLKGTNNEYTLSKAFRDFGAIPVVVDLTGEYTDAVREQVVDAIQKSQIIAITDGPIPEEERARFVGLMCEKAIKAEANKLMGEREGLAIGTGAGFDILNRLGMLAADEINPSKRDFDLLPGNLGRRIFTTATVKVASTLSPWAYGLEPGEVYSVRLATDGARLSATPEVLEEMIRTGRIATQFVDADGFATMESPYNAVGADMAIEGVFSPTGRVFGRCATNERADVSYVGTDSAWDMKVFEWGVKYFK